MGSMSDYLEKEILDHVLSAATYTAPATVYLALFTATPSDTGGGTECTGGSYARVAITNNATNWPAATGTSPATKASGAAFTFPAATADWGTVTSWALFDAATVGNMLYWGALSVSKAILNGDTASFASGQISITQD